MVTISHMIHRCSPRGRTLVTNHTQIMTAAVMVVRQSGCSPLRVGLPSQVTKTIFDFLHLAFQIERS